MTVVAERIARVVVMDLDNLVPHTGLAEDTAEHIAGHAEDAVDFEDIVGIVGIADFAERIGGLV